jgi:hypothetical protein
VLRERRHPAGARERACARRREALGEKILVGLSGRGDKDMPTLQRTLLVQRTPQAQCPPQAEKK